MESRITKIEISLNDNERYIIEVTKRFAPEHSGEIPRLNGNNFPNL